MSNALWKGVPRRRLLEASGLQPGVVNVRLHAADGYTDTLTHPEGATGYRRMTVRIET